MVQPTLEQVKNWSIKAGEILAAGYGKKHDIQHKGVADLVTEIDHRSEEYLLEQIRQYFPKHTVIAEESGHMAGDADYCWYIDPLDGTTNYAHDIPFFAVSIGYAEKGQMRLGVVIDPMRKECFSAELGRGAWLNDEAIHVSDASEMIHSLFVTGFPYHREGHLDNTEFFGRFTRISQGVRRLGSAALDLAYVAAGRLEGYWELTLKAYDLAAGALIVKEAGGVATNLTGGSFMQSPYAIVAANPHIHPQMLEVLRP